MDKSNKMLIDATHPEETRVVVLRNARVEEFDYESAARKLLRGNIYLAKVTRVEPSLQAAFVDYGGNRHGFLAFSEIHPDYYQIPVADRQALLQEEAQADAEAEAEADAEAEAAARSGEGRQRREAMTEASGEDRLAALPPFEPASSSRAEEGAEGAQEPPRFALPGASGEEEERGEGDNSAEERSVEAPFPTLPEEEGVREEGSPAVLSHVEEIAGDGAEAPETVSTVEPAGAADVMEEVPERPRRRVRAYKIQEVIKRRQIILVQVVKEERGSKGAALTTYLSLAGRYTVLMPNTGRGGGISRKITNPQDRKRLKAIAHELEVPEGMGLIIRTAGAARTKQEIKRDFEYEIRLWENVRDLTLTSTAPCLVYEEGNLIKRSIRDLYSKDMDEILVAGEAAFLEAQSFMSMLSPGQAASVSHYREPEPLFARYQIERQLNAMFSPYVTLRSGGYLVINQTEALVSIDVNSGKATREFSIEETALHTNVEAAEEIARQLKLRDLAGLIVIDFIDMEERRNNRKVESRLKEALRHDRARIQVGRISHFGLLEMSRQRLRTGVLEGSTTQCAHCQGTGIIRSVESVALAVLRALEDHLLRDQRSSLCAVTTAEVALYILNNKRFFVTDMERRYGVTVTVQASDRMQGANFAIERSSAHAYPQRAPERTVVNMESGFDGPEEEAAEGLLFEPEREEEPSQGREFWEKEREEEGSRRPRGRRRRRGRREERAERRGAGRSGARAELPDTEASEAWEQPAEPVAVAQAPAPEPAGTGAQPRLEGEDLEERRRPRRRRGRRGGRRGRAEEAPRGQEDAFASADLAMASAEGEVLGGEAGQAPFSAGTPAAPEEDGGQVRKQASQDQASQDQALQGQAAEGQAAEGQATEGQAAEGQARGQVGIDAAPEWAEPQWQREPHGNGAPRETPGRAQEQALASEPHEGGSAPVHAEPVPEEPAQPARKGWWQRRFSAQ